MELLALTALLDSNQMEPEAHVSPAQQTATLTTSFRNARCAHLGDSWTDLHPAVSLVANVQLGQLPRTALALSVHQADRPTRVELSA